MKMLYALVGISMLGLSVMVFSKEEFLVIGHRGACGYVPENTLSSFKKAVELGVDMIEFDVHCCASGELMVIHDNTLDRTTNTTGYIKDFTLDQLNNAVNIKNSKERIPTLNEVLDTIGHAAMIAIELKGPGTAQPVARIVQEYLDKGWHSDNFYILSFDHLQLQEFHEYLPEIKRCATVYGMPLEYPLYAKKHGFNAVATCYEYATQQFVAAAHKAGLKVFIYTANDPHIIKKLLEIGVDGIFSDYPDRIQHELK
ncbi:MAG: glycerophosphodiester phosphodiesterase [Candidatus Babeliales bacterium]